MKNPLHCMKRNRLRIYGGRNPTVVIAIEMDIEEPLVGISIQRSTLETRHCDVN